MQCSFDNTTYNSRISGNYSGDVWCPPTYDEYLCWDETPAGAVAHQSCPGFVSGFDSTREASKTCLEDGTWYTDPEGNKSWTNYTTCVGMDDLSFRIIVYNIYVFGYAVSTTALLISLALFSYFRRLLCTRIRIHMHLFTSFVLNNVLWTIWYIFVINSAPTLKENEPWCQVLHVITTYCMVTNYFWMFNEGLHLHIALVVVFVKEITLKWFVVIGWGLSFVIVGIYAVGRYYSGATERCWIDEDAWFWVINAPIGLSLCCSLVFLINVVRVMMTKVYQPSNQSTMVSIKKAVRAVFILIPLFGLHILIFPVCPGLDNGTWEKAYQVISAFLRSLQGLCLAVLFCFTNNDVTIMARTHMAKILRKHEAFAMTGVGTGGGSAVNVRENII